MISYVKLMEKLKAEHINSLTVKKEKITGQETYRKIRKGTGIFDEGYDASNKILVFDENNNPVLDENGKQKEKQATKRRLTAIDTKSIEAFCKRLNCQPGDLMDFIPNTWDNADRLLEALNYTLKDKDKYTRADLSKILPMEPPEDPESLLNE